MSAPLAHARARLTPPAQKACTVSGSFVHHLRHLTDGFCQRLMNGQEGVKPCVRVAAFIPGDVVRQNAAFGRRGALAHSERQKQKLTRALAMHKNTTSPLSA